MDSDIHPLANIFPSLSQAEYERLKADIDANGQQSPIAYYQNKIIDGRHRYRACKELGIEPMECELNDGDYDDGKPFDPLSYVISANLHRRHLSKRQRAVIGARMATLGHGQRKNGADTANAVSQDDAAGLLGVSVDSIQRAKHVLENGHPKLIELVEQDRVSVSLASKFIREVPDKKEQAKIVKLGVEGVKQAVPTNTKQKVSSDWEGDLVAAWCKARDHRKAIDRLYDEFTAEDISYLRSLLNGEA